MLYFLSERSITLSNKLTRCGDAAPDDTYVMLQCDYCEGEELFPHKGKGRRPKMCPWGRAEHTRIEAEERKNRKSESNGTRVPVFSTLNVDTVEKGDLIYHLTKNTPILRKYAREFKVKSISEEHLELITTKKTHYVSYPMKVALGSKHLDNLYEKTGYEYVDIHPDEEIGDYDDE